VVTLKSVVPFHAINLLFFLRHILAQCLYTVTEDNAQFISLVEQKPQMFAKLPELIQQPNDNENAVFLSVLVSGKLGIVLEILTQLAKPRKSSL